MWNTFKKWLTIDRIDNNWNYSKENCKWSSTKEQWKNKRSNTRIVIQWESLILTERAKKLWCCYQNLQRLKKRFWTYENAIKYRIDVLSNIIKHS